MEAQFPEYILVTAWKIRRLGITHGLIGDRPGQVDVEAWDLRYMTTYFPKTYEGEANEVQH